MTQIGWLYNEEMNTWAPGEITAASGGLPAGGTTGEVLTKVSDADGDADWEPGGGSQPGAARVLGPFPFAFDDPGLVNGITFYTPAVNDILLDVWVQVIQSFDGTPYCDVGTLLDSGFGLFAANNGPLDMTSPPDSAGLSVNPGIISSQSRTLLTLNNINLAVIETSFRLAPARFTDANPLKIVVSEDGAAGSGATGSTQGSGAVYIVVATPSLT